MATKEKTKTAVYKSKYSNQRVSLRKWSPGVDARGRTINVPPVGRATAVFRPVSDTDASKGGTFSTSDPEEIERLDEICRLEPHIRRIQ